MRNVKFSADELRNPRVEILKVDRATKPYPGDRELVGVVRATLCGHKLEPLLVVRSRDGEFEVRVIEYLPLGDGWLSMSDSPYWLRLCAPCVTRRMRDRVQRVVLTHVRGLLRSEKAGS
jgi:hypothetical protein